MLIVAGLLAACATPPTPSLTEMLARPAEQALLGGMRLYDDGDYPAAERELERAIVLDPRAPRDRATAQKYLAFIYCTSGRETPCEYAFRAAIAADPVFELTRAEEGHPVWGPVYRRVRASLPALRAEPPAPTNPPPMQRKTANP